MAGAGRAPVLRVVGAGLMGTSVALAATRAGWDVDIVDVDEQRQIEAAQRLGTTPGFDPQAEPLVVCVAVPPTTVPHAVESALRTYVDATVIDLASVKNEPQHEIELLGMEAVRFIGTHPLAGSERPGPAAARADLFRGRSWVVCSTRQSSASRLADVERLIGDCGAHPVHLSPAVHDRLLATTSHLPQLVASALAGLVADAFSTAATPGWSTDIGSTEPSPVPASALAGPALLDMTRIADSPAPMWAEIVAANTEPVRAGVSDLIARLELVRDGLSSPASASEVVRRLVEGGREARHRMGLKHAGASSGVGAAGPAREAGWTWVDTLIDDTPGTLARVFATAARIGVNVEDVRVDHAPYAAAGLVSVALMDDAAARSLREALTADARP